MIDRDRFPDEQRSPASTRGTLPPDGDGDDPQLIPGYRNYLIFGDESGTGGASHYGFGTLWIPFQRRGDLWRAVQELRDEHGYTSEIKWNKVSRGNEAFFRDLMILFFERRWMMFHGLFVRKAYVDLSFHKGDWDLARRKHQTLLLSNKIAYFSGGASDIQCHFRVDPIPSRYAKADEVMHKVSNYELENTYGIKPLVSVRAVDSKESLGIQLCDFLLGAAMAEWQSDMTSDHKKRMTALMADLLNWPDMKADTFPHEWKFNIWSFHNPAARLPRDRKTRPVRLRYPMPTFRPRR
jgi:hypothetical protein